MKGVSSRARLLEIAVKDASRAEGVFVSRTRGSFRDMLFYLYWRNRFPVLNRLVEISLITIEVALLFTFFYTPTRKEISFIIFALFLSRTLFEGLIQPFRIELTKKESLQSEELSQGISSGVIFVLRCSMTASCLLLLCLLFFELHPLSWVLLLGWALVLPLEQTVYALWGLLYTRSRYSRSFTVLVLLRCLPVIVLVTLAPAFGVVTYIIALILHRALEALYVGWLARQAFSDLGARVVTPKRILEIARHYRIIPRLLFTASLTVYFLLVGAFWYQRGEWFWIQHFFFFQLVGLFAYPILRIARSTAFDLTQSLRGLSLSYAAFLWRSMERYSVVAWLVSVFIILSVVVSNLAVLSQISPYVLSLAPYFAALVMLRGIVEAEFVYFRTAAIEPRAVWSMVSIFTIGALGQFFLITHYRANLQASYLFESFLFLAVFLLLKYAKKLESSEILEVSKQSIREQHATLLPEDFESTPGITRLHFLKVASEYVDAARQVTVTELVGHGRSDGPYKLISGVLFFYPKEFELSPAVEAYFSGHTSLSRTESLFVGLESIAKLDEQGFSKSTRMRRFFSRIQTGLGVLQDAKVFESRLLTCEGIESILNDHLKLPVPYARLRSSPSTVGEVSEEFWKVIGRYRSRTLGAPLWIPEPEKPYIGVFERGRARLLYDLSKYPEDGRYVFSALAETCSLCLLLAAFKGGGTND